MTTKSLYFNGTFLLFYDSITVAIRGNDLGYNCSRNYIVAWPSLLLCIEREMGLFADHWNSPDEYC